MTVRFLIFAACFMVLLITACEKEESISSPAVTFIRNGMKVCQCYLPSNSEVQFEIRVSAEGGLKSIQVFEGSNFADKTLVLSKESGFETDTSDVIALSKIVKTTSLTYFVDVFDREDRYRFSYLIFTVGNYKTISTFSNISMGFDVQWNPGPPALATSSGETFFASQFGSALSRIDMFYNQDNQGTPSLFSPRTYYANGNQTFFVSTNIAPEEFDQMSNDAAMQGLSPTLTNIAVRKGAVIGFITASTKKGLIKVNDFSSGSNNWKLILTVKVQN